MFLAQMVQFDYDSSAVRPSDLPKVELVAQHLIQNPTHKLLIEGHCDERGTEDYNVSLGERRALAVLDELLRLGISQDRLRTTSYGEKVPLMDGLTEALLLRIAGANLSCCDQPINPPAKSPLAKPRATGAFFAFQ